MQSVELASQRAAISARTTMSRGIQSLTLISATAALIGFFGTVVGIMNSFKSMGTSKTTAMAAIADRLSQAMVPGILGLLVAILALWFHRYLSNELEAFDVQMKNASADLVNRLVMTLPWFALEQQHRLRRSSQFLFRSQRQPTGSIGQPHDGPGDERSACSQVGLRDQRKR
jgi:hypothetical protein